MNKTSRSPPIKRIFHRHIISHSQQKFPRLKNKSCRAIASQFPTSIQNNNPEEHNLLSKNCCFSVKAVVFAEIETQRK